MYLFKLSLLGLFFSEHVRENPGSRFEVRHFSPGDNRQPDNYYSRADKIMGSITDGKADEHQNHQQGVVENAVRARSRDGFSELADFVIYVVKIFHSSRSGLAAGQPPGG